jgi:sialate O-acetylesterase
MSVLVVTLLAFALPAVRADVRLPAIFGDNMVLQQGDETAVWGWAEPGEQVKVAFAGREAAARAGGNGKWTVRLKNLEAGGPRKMVISGKNRIELANVAVGEVWICSGQSNMEWRLDKAANAQEELSGAEYPNMRLFQVPRRTAIKPVEDTSSRWRVCTQRSADQFSAAGYFFGRYLHRQLDVPVGLIQAAWGGTRIEPWIPAEQYKQTPLLKKEFLPYIENADQKFRLAVAQALDSYEQYLPGAKKALEAGLDVPEPPEWPVHPLARDQQQPTCLFNGMINPIVPFAIRGAIWYQGESNCIQKDGLKYYFKFAAMVRGWRELWGRGDFPFYFVQLAPYDYTAHGLEPAELPEMWEAQALCLQLPNTGMAVTVDIGNTRDIHPRNKQDVGRRLALWAMAKDYGRKDLVYSGPLYKSKSAEGGRIRIFFDHAGTGLVSRDERPLTWFAIAGADRKFVDANARIEGDTVVVWSESVAEPVAVRFAWNQVAEPNLGNKEGLPAAPFRTDGW